MKLAQVATKIISRQPFKASNLRGTTTFEGLGKMPRAYDAFAIAQADFLVYSYQTPIAWFVSGSWVVPAESYSISTTRHQNLVREALRHSRAVA